MIYMLFRSGLSGSELVIMGCILVIVLVFSLSIHEIMHGYVAFRLGDDTAKMQGRLTLNPLAHLDPSDADDADCRFRLGKTGTGKLWKTDSLQEQICVNPACQYCRCN